MAWTVSDKAGTAQPYVYNPYPKHVYHFSGDGRWKEVQDEAAWAALGAEWGYSTPEPDITAIADAKHAIAEKPKRKARG